MTIARAASVLSSGHIVVETCTIEGLEASLGSGGNGAGIRMERWARQGAMRRRGLLMTSP